MAVIHTTFTDLTDFQASLDAKGSAGTALSSAYSLAAASFQDFGASQLFIDGGATTTHATGTVFPFNGGDSGGTFIVDGSSLGSSTKRLTRLRYQDGDEAGNVDFRGNFSVSGPNPAVIITAGGN